MFGRISSAIFRRRVGLCSMRRHHSRTAVRRILYGQREVHQSPILSLDGTLSSEPPTLGTHMSRRQLSSSIVSTAPRDAAWHQILSTPRSLVPSLIMIHRPSGRCHKPISATNSTHAPLEAGQQQLINECGYTSSLGRSVVGTWRSRYTCNRRLALRLMEPQRSIHAAAID